MNTVCSNFFKITQLTIPLNLTPDFSVIRFRGCGHVQIIARYCLDYHLDGKFCPSDIYRLINESQSAHYIENVTEVNTVESGDVQTVSSHPRASSLELLEKRLKTVEEDPNHILRSRMSFFGRQFRFLGKPIS